MDIFRFPIVRVATNPYDERIKFTFCSKRLAKLMLKKSMSGEWVYPYFSSEGNKVFDGYVTHIISNQGLLVMVKK